MLSQILDNAIPLQEKVTLPDPFGFGIELEIYRLDATGYQKAENAVNPQLQLGQSARDAVRKATRKAKAKTKGSRRGQGGVLVGLDEEAIIEDTFTDELASGFTETITLEDKIPAIAEHLCGKVKVPKGFGKAWGVDEDTALAILSTAPAAKSGDRYTYPAAFKGEGDWRDGTAGLEKVWDIDDAKNLSEREKVPFGGTGDARPGLGWGAVPTLNNMLAAWILDSARTTELFEPTPGAVDEGVETIRPISPGKDSSSAGGAPKTGAG